MADRMSQPMTYVVLNRRIKFTTDHDVRLVCSYLPNKYPSYTAFLEKALTRLAKEEIDELRMQGVIE